MIQWRTVYGRFDSRFTHMPAMIVATSRYVLTLHQAAAHASKQTKESSGSMQNIFTPPTTLPSITATKHSPFVLLRTFLLRNLDLPLLQNDDTRSVVIRGPKRLLEVLVLGDYTLHNRIRRNWSFMVPDVMTMGSESADIVPSTRSGTQTESEVLHPSRPPGHCAS